MRTFLFLTTKTIGLDPEKDRILQLGTRLVDCKATHDFCQIVHSNSFSISAKAANIDGISDRVSTDQEPSIGQVLGLLQKNLRQAEIIIGHNIARDLAIISAEARRAGWQDIQALLTHPHFGFDGGALVAICTRQLAADYLRHLGETPSRSNTKLISIYRRLFEEELVGTHDALIGAIASQRIYSFLSAFQVESGVQFSSDIICFED
jgi:DNA polymerase III epsilon subunit-like protein